MGISPVIVGALAFVGTTGLSPYLQKQVLMNKAYAARSAAMRNIIYIIGLIVVVMFLLSLFGLR